MDELEVAVCQLTSIDDLTQNTDAILSCLRALEEQTPQLICFPENCLYMRVREGQSIAGISLHDPHLLRLVNWAMAHQSTLHLGSVPIEQDGKLYNSTLLIYPDGSIKDIYRKIHLFDVDVAGHKPVRESDVFAGGNAPQIFEVAGWRFGSSICYDLRFAELYSVYARAGVDAILIPSAFLVPTGEAHWHVLLRARAIESQCYVLAAAQGGTHTGSNAGAAGSQRKTFGHSMIVGPWGEVLAESGPAVLRIKLSKSRLKDVRSQIPMSGHRRDSIFSLQSEKR